MADDGLQSIYKSLMDSLVVLGNAVEDWVDDEYAKELLRYDINSTRIWVKRAINYQPE